MAKLRVAFIGAGRISDLHRLGYVDNPRAVLYAVCDANDALAQATRSRRHTAWASTITLHAAPLH